MPNTTHFPTTIKEFVRVYIHEDEDAVESLGVIPMCDFRLPTGELINITNEVISKISEVFAIEDIPRMDQLANYHFNTVLNRMCAEGRLIIADNLKPFASSNEVDKQQSGCISFTNDGYAVLSTVHFPLITSNRAH